MAEQFVPWHQYGEGRSDGWRRLVDGVCPLVSRLVDWTGTWVRRRPATTYLRAGARSAQCEYRPDNEDAFYSDGELGLFVVADGVGGNRGGKTAAQFVIDAFATVFHELPRGKVVGPLDVKRGIERSLDLAQSRMGQFSRRNLEYERMASTMAVAIVCDGTMFVSHVGDSRVYHCDRRGLKQITTDDTYARALVDAGVLSPQEAASHPMRNVLLTTVNGWSPVSTVPMIIRYLAPGERVLLATDGLTQVVGEQELCRIIHGAPTAQEAADALVRRALELDTHDNTTCVVVERLLERDLPAVDETTGRTPELCGHAALEAA